MAFAYWSLRHTDHPVNPLKIESNVILRRFRFADRPMLHKNDWSMESLQQMLRHQAWIGDAVLSLFARKWLLENVIPVSGWDRQELLGRLTSNQFLSAFGEPTVVEARIGRLYTDKGLDTAFAWMETELIPLFLKQIRKQQPSGRKSAR